MDFFLLLFFPLIPFHIFLFFSNRMALTHFFLFHILLAIWPTHKEYIFDDDDDIYDTHTKELNIYSGNNNRNKQYTITFVVVVVVSSTTIITTTTTKRKKMVLEVAIQYFNVKHFSFSFKCSMEQKFTFFERKRKKFHARFIYLTFRFSLIY